MGHEAHDCKTALQRPQLGSRAGVRSLRKSDLYSTSCMCDCALQVSRKKDEEEEGFGAETLELKSGEKINVLNATCVEADIKNNLPMLSGKVGGRKVR